VKRALRNNGLSLFFFALFVAALIGPALAHGSERTRGAAACVDGGRGVNPAAQNALVRANG
jgi:hypothetical protein